MPVFSRSLLWTWLPVGALFLAITPFANAQEEDLPPAPPAPKASNVGYVESALPANIVGFRFDSIYNATRSDRAGYLYPAGFNGNLNSQEPSLFVEWAVQPSFSVFLQVMAQTYQATTGGTPAELESGFADMNLGFKWAFLQNDDQVASFLLRAYLPTGDVNVGLGTGHVSLEPGFLYYQKLTERLTLESQLKDFIPLTRSGDTQTSFAGNVLEYGAGLSYNLIETPRFRISPVFEVAGWTVLSGSESISPTTTQSARGDTIIDLKPGVRVRFGERSDIYVGYGHSVTGDFWYKNIVRVEYRLSF